MVTAPHAAANQPVLVPQAAGGDGLDTDAEPAIGIAGNGTAEPGGHEDDGQHHNSHIYQRLPDADPRQQLRQDDQKARPKDRSEQGGQATQDNNSDELDGEKK